MREIINPHLPLNSYIDKAVKILLDDIKEYESCISINESTDIQTNIYYRDKISTLYYAITALEYYKNTKPSDEDIVNSRMDYQE